MTQWAASLRHLRRASASAAPTCARGPVPAGVIVPDDGQTFVVDRDYVPGRGISTTTGRPCGRARPTPLIVADPGWSISPVHARIGSSDEWDVRLSDCTSANGTFTARRLDWTPGGARPPGHHPARHPRAAGPAHALFDSPTRRLG